MLPRQRHLRQISKFLSPALFSGGGKDGIVKENGVVWSHDCEFSFTNPDDAVPTGSKITLFVGQSGIWCETQDDRDAYLRWLEQKRDQERQEARERAARIAAEDKAFNDALGLPFQWQPGHKVVLSGLRENSWGDGTYRNTVEHVMLLEDVEIGRLKRKRGQFLCSTEGGLFEQDIEMNQVSGRVTCKACLKAAQRFKP